MIKFWICRHVAFVLTGRLGCVSRLKHLVAAFGGMGGTLLLAAVAALMNYAAVTSVSKCSAGDVGTSTTGGCSRIISDTGDRNTMSGASAATVQIGEIFGHVGPCTIHTGAANIPFS